MPSTTIQTVPALRQHPHLYEINTWAWLEELSAREHRPVTLGSVPEAEWDKLKALGFDLVWLMGIWKRSILGRRVMRTSAQYFSSYDAALPGWTVNDIVGSPYSVQATTPDTRIGNWEDLDAVREKLRARGMRLILDFVPNHTGLDHPWISAHPEYYVQGTLDGFRRDPSAFFLAERDNAAWFIAHGKDPFCPAWPDTAQLNYFNPELRTAMLGVLRTIAAHSDGVRCDMAMLSLNDVFGKTWDGLLTGFPAPREEFWTAAVAAMPNFIWLAEVYWDMEWRLQQLGLTFTYDKRLYDRLRSAAPPEVRDHLKADVRYQTRSVRFLENHDEPRCAAVFGSEKLPAAATIVATLPGVRFYHQGQLEGKKLHLPIQLSRAATEPPDPQLQGLYAKLLAITGEDVFHQGDWRRLEAREAGDPSFANLVAYQWHKNDTLKVIAANLSSAPAQANITVDAPIDAARRHLFHDQLNDRSYVWEGRDLARTGLFVRLEAFRSHIFDVREFPT